MHAGTSQHSRLQNYGFTWIESSYHRAQSPQVERRTVRPVGIHVRSLMEYPGGPDPDSISRCHPFVPANISMLRRLFSSSGHPTVWLVSQ